jgi:hypothetical protein
MVRLTAPSYAKTVTLCPFSRADWTILRAVVEFADSYGASMIATVIVLPEAMITSNIVLV